MRSAPRIDEIRAALWAARALTHVRRQLADGRMSALELPRPPALPLGAGRGIEAFLRRRSHSCLEAALIRQRWLAAHDDHREIVIGVTSPHERFRAHAWIDGDPSATGRDFTELTRLR
jgi:hypothetical protein